MNVDETPPEGAMLSLVSPEVCAPEPTLAVEPRKAAVRVRQVPTLLRLKRCRHVLQENVCAVADRLPRATPYSTPVVPSEEHLAYEAIWLHPRHVT